MEISPDRWTLQLFLFSCRAARRAVDELILSRLLSEARQARLRVFARFKPTRRNEPLLQLYLQGGFERIDTCGDLLVLEHRLESIADQPCRSQLCFERPCRMSANLGG
jgi:predicted enzyme involved in methoxymalonyl-ACP biosynthesis